MRGSERQCLLALVHKRGQHTAPCRRNSGPGCTASRGSITVPATPATPTNKGNDDPPWDSHPVPKFSAFGLPDSSPTTGFHPPDVKVQNATLALSVIHSLSQGQHCARDVQSAGSMTRHSPLSHGLLFRCGGPPHKRYNELQRGQLRKLHIH